ncbi:hypothetical protein, partial [Pseudomonas lundensis]|uniref:hypothetical protein n=1 Tax=Pseudomonas lundensis TaxID=86185 RepID=UPI003FD1D105
SGLFCVRSKSERQAFIDNKRHISESSPAYAQSPRRPSFQPRNLNLRQTAESISKYFNQKDW